MKKTVLVLSLSLFALTSSEVYANVAGSFEGYDDVSSYIVWDEEVYLDGVVNAYANIDWQDLTVTGNVTSYSYYHSLSKARTADVWDITTQASWVVDSKNDNHITFAESPIPSTAENEPMKAIGETKTDLIASESEVLLLSSHWGAYSAEARAMKGQTYVVNADTVVTFSVPYYVDVEVFDYKGDNSEYGYARAWSWLRLYNGTTKTWDQIAGTYTYQDVEGDGNGTGSLQFSYAAVKDSYLLFEAGADTRVALANPVPVPPSVLMLLTGCTSLFFMRRRKN